MSDGVPPELLPIVRAAAAAKRQRVAACLRDLLANTNTEDVFEKLRDGDGEDLATILAQLELRPRDAVSHRTLLVFAWMLIEVRFAQSAADGADARSLSAAALTNKFPPVAFRRWRRPPLIQTVSLNEAAALKS